MATMCKRNGANMSEVSNTIIGGLNADELVGITLMVIAVMGLLFSRIKNNEDESDI